MMDRRSSLRYWSTFVCFGLALCISQVIAESSPSEFDHYDDELRKLQRTSTTTEKVNIWQKLKESLGMAIVGILLICISPIVIWKNEGRHVRELKRIDFCKNEATVVDSNAPGDDTVGQLVHFTGQVQVGEEGLEFSGGGGLNVTSVVQNAILMKRTCYIYQKFEESKTEVQRNTVGGGETRTTTYSFREDWTAAGPQEERLEHLPEEVNSRGIWDQLVEQAGDSVNVGGSGLPELPEGMAKAIGLFDSNEKPHAMEVAASARVGEYGLSRTIIVENARAFCAEMTPVAPENLPDQVEGCEGLAKGSDNVLRTFPEEEEPQNGDCKVVYEYAAAGFDCSFIVQQTSTPSEQTPLLESSAAKYGVDRAAVTDEQCFGKCPNDYGEIWMVRRGTHDLEEMVDLATEEENQFTMIIRLVGYAMLLGGWCMLFSPFTTALQVLPFLGTLGNFAVFLTGLIVSFMCCCTVMTTAYIRYRPLLAIALLVVAGGIWGIVAWRLGIAAQEGGELAPTPAPTPA